MNSVKDNEKEPLARTQPPHEKIKFVKCNTFGARYALCVLTFINLLNYLDRYIPSALKDSFKNDLHLSDVETSLPLTAFLVVYMLSCPLFGALADKGYSRKGLISFGVVLWSASTSAVFFSNYFWSFLFFRSLVGVGEASYATIAPALLSDFFPQESRNRVMAIFYAASPVGAALGYILGGLLDTYFGWRYAFLICGMPGLALSLLALLIRNSTIGALDKEKDLSPIPWFTALKLLLHNEAYLYALFGSIFLTFAVGGMADWMPTFLQRVNHASIESSNIVVGVCTVIGGIGGTTLGGFLADQMKNVIRNSYFSVSALALIPSATGAVLLLLVSNLWIAAVILLFCEIATFCNSGPMGAICLNTVHPNLRARAFSVWILAVHLFGDAISPTIIGYISQETGSLKIAATIIPITIGCAALIWGIGSRVVSTEYMKLSSSSSSLKNQSHIVLEEENERNEASMSE